MDTGDGAVADASTEVVADPATDPAADESTTTIPAPLFPVADDSSKSKSKRSRGKRTRKRPALHVVAGAVAARRTATLGGGSNADDLPCYCTKDDNGNLVGNPFFPKGYVALEFYPLALDGKGKMLEGLGLHLESTFTQVTTGIGDSNSITSNVYAVKGGASFRLVLFDSKTAPDITFKLGGAYTIFPLSEGAFPGVRYTHLGYGGLTITLPIIEDMLAVQAGGTYTFALSPSGRTKELGTYEKGSTYEGGGGVRLSFDPIEVRVFAKYSKFELGYSGDTVLTESAVQGTDVTLEDSTLSFGVAAGVAF